MKSYGMMRLGRDAEVRRTPSGEAVCNLSLAFNYGKKGDDGNRPTQWIDAAFWGQRAENLAQFLTKGSLHCFTLRDVHIETYQDKDGYEAFKLVATVDDVELGGKSNGSSEGGGSSSGEPPKRRPAGGSGGESAPKDKPKPSFDDLGDDIPF